MVVVAALFATISIGATACSGQTGAVVAPSVSATSRSTPVRLRIAAIGVDSGLMDLGLRADGSLEVPPSGFPAGWYTGGPTPGELGPAIIAGHIDWNGPGVFYNLHNLKPGDQVTVTRADGSQPASVSYTHLRAHETRHDLVCRLLLEKKKTKIIQNPNHTKPAKRNEPRQAPNENIK